MGIGHSRAESSANPPTKTIRIDKEEIPEEFRNVGVSSEVVDRVLNEGTNSKALEALREELLEARRRNEDLLNELQKRSEANVPYNIAGKITVEELEGRRKAFNEAIERVEKQFCSFQRENVCEAQEKEIMECVVRNKDKVLNCVSLLSRYQDCIMKFRNEVLTENSNA